VINPTRNVNYPVAQNDSTTITPGETVYVQVLNNDTHPSGDSAYISNVISFFGGFVGGNAELTGDSVRISLGFDSWSALNRGKILIRNHRLALGKWQVI
jgi:hypothetical protein